MEVLLLALLALGLLAAMAGLLAARHRKSGEEVPAPRRVPQGCCGQHAVCEKTALLSGLSRNIEYYDDEELDRFAGRASDAYTPEEEDAFREVLYTMHPDEVTGWVRSLGLRGIEVPDGLKDEVFLLVER